MCGIIGILGNDDVAPRLLAGLKRLEYRGYDSAGIATVHDADRSTAAALPGKLDNLAARARGRGFRCPATSASRTRVGRRTARPTEDNAHPHATDEVAVVHNGIIENFKTACVRN